MTESLLLLSDFEKMLLDRIEDLRSRIHKTHNPIYNETVMIEIETVQWVLSQIDRPKQSLICLSSPVSSGFPRVFIMAASGYLCHDQLA